jgi:hypothetical protein
MEKLPLIKLIGLAVGCIVMVSLILWLLPHIQMFLALCGAWYLWREYGRNQWRDRP